MPYKKYGWDTFLFIEEEFIQARRYIDFTTTNMSATSVFFSNQTILLGAEIEKAFKYLIQLIDSDKSRGNMADFKQESLLHYPKIPDFYTYIKDEEIKFYPFHAWHTNGGKLSWWNVYNEEKHGNKKSTLKDCLELLSAFEILLLIIHSEEINHPEFRIKEKQYIRYSITDLPKLLETKFLRRSEISDGVFISYFANQFKENNIEILCAQYGLSY